MIRRLQERSFSHRLILTLIVAVSFSGCAQAEETTADGAASAKSSYESLQPHALSVVGGSER
jgi:hypothetical protein